MTAQNAITTAGKKPLSTNIPFTLALGGGAARGIGHIPVLEALDELGVKPDLIVGTSMGSIYGASYAAGMSAKEIREYSIETFESRVGLVKRILNNWSGSITDLWNPLTSSLFDPVNMFEILLPDPIRTRIEDLNIPFEAVTTDFYTHNQKVVKRGPVIPAIAASSSLPGLFKPVEIEGALLIDGGFVNPTPFDVAKRPGAISIAVDVTGDTGVRIGDERPTPTEAWIGAAQIMLHSITREKLKSEQPDILIRPNVGLFGAMEFHKVEEILKSSEPAKDELKRELDHKIQLSI